MYVPQLRAQLLHTYILLPSFVHNLMRDQASIKKGLFLVNELVQRLAAGEHPVVIGGSQSTLEEFHKRIEDMGYVFIKFTGTKGGTDLGVRVDKQATDLSRADFDARTGTVHVEGTLTLNYVKVRCVANIDLASLNGLGHLVILEEMRI